MFCFRFDVIFMSFDMKINIVYIDCIKILNVFGCIVKFSSVVNM